MLNANAFTVVLRTMGELVQWLKASPCDCYNPSLNYDQQRTCTKCSHGWVYQDKGTFKALVASEKHGVLHQDLGWVQERSLTLTVPADVARIGTGDRIVLLARTTLARVRMAHGTDVLPHLRPVELQSVKAGETAYNVGVDYTFDATTRTITWLLPTPPQFYAVEYTYRPEYFYLGQEERPPRPTGIAGQATPLKGTLTNTPPE